MYVVYVLSIYLFMGMNQGVPFFYFRFNHYALQTLPQAEPTGVRKCKDNFHQEFKDWKT